MISIDNLCMRYPGGITALHPTSAEFYSGHFTVFLGASGAGKSTLLRCLNVLNTASEGTVEVEGLGILNGNSRLIREHRKATAMIFQQHQLIERHTALQNVLVGRIASYGTLRSLFPLPRYEQEFALDCLNRVGLLDKALERVKNLSGGQQQRVGIARALAQRPKLILADEPVASLDPATARKVLSLLHKITKEDAVPAIVSLHQVQLAKEYADRIIGLAGGRVVFDGTPDQLTASELARIYRDGKATKQERLQTPNRHDIFQESESMHERTAYRVAAQNGSSPTFAKPPALQRS
jgi:phosphonate transport system ATP-binding protein